MAQQHLQQHPAGRILLSAPTLGTEDLITAVCDALRLKAYMPPPCSQDQVDQLAAEIGVPPSSLSYCCCYRTEALHRERYDELQLLLGERYRQYITDDPSSPLGLIGMQGLVGTRRRLLRQGGGSGAGVGGGAGSSSSCSVPGSRSFESADGGGVVGGSSSSRVCRTSSSGGGSSSCSREVGWSTTRSSGAPGQEGGGWMKDVSMVIRASLMRSVRAQEGLANGSEYSTAARLKWDWWEEDGVHYVCRSRHSSSTELIELVQVGNYFGMNEAGRMRVGGWDGVDKRKQWAVGF